MKYRMLIDGEWRDAESGETSAVINPATEETVAEVPFGGRAEAVNAVDAAVKAYPKWSYFLAMCFFKGREIRTEVVSPVFLETGSGSGGTTITGFCSNI